MYIYICIRDDLGCTRSLLRSQASVYGLVAAIRSEAWKPGYFCSKTWDCAIVLCCWTFHISLYWFTIYFPMVVSGRVLICCHPTTCWMMNGTLKATPAESWAFAPLFWWYSASFELSLSILLQVVCTQISFSWCKRQIEVWQTEYKLNKERFNSSINRSTWFPHCLPALPTSFATNVLLYSIDSKDDQQRSTHSYTIYIYIYNICMIYIYIHNMYIYIYMIICCIYIYICNYKYT